MTRPIPVVGLRQRRRLDGTPFLCGTLDVELVLAPGTELHLMRVAPDGSEQPTHCLRVFPPHGAPSKRDLARAARDRLDASAIRHDSRDVQEHHP